MSACVLLDTAAPQLPLGGNPFYTAPVGSCSCPRGHLASLPKGAGPDARGPSQGQRCGRSFTFERGCLFSVLLAGNLRHRARAGQQVGVGWGEELDPLRSHRCPLVQVGIQQQEKQELETRGCGRERARAYPPTPPCMARRYRSFPAAGPVQVRRFRTRRRTARHTVGRHVQPSGSTPSRAQGKRGRLRRNNTAHKQPSAAIRHHYCN